MGSKDKPYYPQSRLRGLTSSITGSKRRAEAASFERIRQKAADELAQNKLHYEFRGSEISFSTKDWRRDLDNNKLAAGLQRAIEAQKADLQKTLGADGWNMYLAWREEHNGGDPYSPLSRLKALTDATTTPTAAPRTESAAQIERPNSLGSSDTETAQTPWDTSDTPRDTSGLDAIECASAFLAAYAGDDSDAMFDIASRQPGVLVAGCLQLADIAVGSLLEDLGSEVLIEMMDNMTMSRANESQEDMRLMRVAMEMVSGRLGMAGGRYISSPSQGTIANPMDAQIVALGITSLLTTCIEISVSEEDETHAVEDFLHFVKTRAQGEAPRHSP